MERDEQLRALIRRNRLLLAVAAELCAASQRRRLQLQAAHPTLERLRQRVHVAVLVKHAKEAASDASERQVTSQHLKSLVAEMLNHRTTS
jgi:hypothetical protein